MSGEWCFVQHFDRVAFQQPDRTAIQVGDDRSISYHELRTQSLAVTSRVSQLAGRSEVVVGMHLEKSPELLAAMIGTWRAGAAWVPIEPTLPASQIEAILANAKPDLVFSNAPSDEPAIGVPVEHLPLSTESYGLSAAPERTAGDLAYLIHTSGTTGSPRAVEVTHAGITNLLREQVRAFEITEGSRCLWFYPPSFDASISDWGTALFAGATLVLEPQISRFSGLDLLSRLHHLQISHADLPPALLRVLPTPEDTLSLKTIIIGGAAADSVTIDRWANHVRLVNVYGPTEATVCTSLEVCAPGRTKATLGQPIAGVDYRVVDSSLQEQEAGQPGELMIGGDCLARGYRNDRDTTQMRFVELHGRRYYRTGDSVTRHIDGEFEFHGRIDRQLSLNGIRVEPEEIEMALCEFPSVTAAAVMMRRISPKSQRPRLVAFVETNDQISAADLRASLNEVLPASKHPQRFHFLPAMPRTSSGKPDLPILRSLSLTAEQPCEEADSTIRLLVSLFRQVLGEPHLGPDDRFLDSGGDSLSAVHLSTLATNRRLDLPLALLSDNPSPRALGLLIKEAAKVPGQLKKIGYRGNVEELRADAKAIAARMAPASRPSSYVPGNTILLTGATGFLGSRVLAELLRISDRSVVCLVRGTAEAVRDRVLRHLIDQELAISDDHINRLKVIVGDITLPRFGWARGDFDTVCRSVGTVVHCAADTNALATYEALRSSNVLGVANLVEFAATANASLHYASTLSVFVGTDMHCGSHNETADIVPTHAFGGYTQSKVAAECVLRSQTSLRNFHVYRLGLLSGDPRTGVYPQTDILTMFVRGLHKLGCVPDQPRELRFDLTSTEYAARAIATVAEETHRQGPREVTWHLAGRKTVTLSRLTRYLRHHFDIQMVSRDEFTARLAEIEASEPGNANFACVRSSFSRWSDSETGDDRHRALDLFQSTEVRFDTESTQQRLIRHGVHCPEQSDDLLDAVLGRLCRELCEGAG